MIKKMIRDSNIQTWIFTSYKECLEVLHKTDTIYCIKNNIWNKILLTSLRKKKFNKLIFYRLCSVFYFHNVDTLKKIIRKKCPPLWPTIYSVHRKYFLIKEIKEKINGNYKIN